MHDTSQRPEGLFSRSRRFLLGLLPAAAAGTALDQILPRTARAGSTAGIYPLDGGLTTLPSLDSRLVNPALVKGGFQTPPNTYFTYPHSNGFLDDTTAVIASEGAHGVITYSALDLVSGLISPLAELGGGPRTYYAVSAVSKTMVVPMNDGVVAIDLSSGTSTRIASFPGWKVMGDIDIHPDGTSALVTRWELADPLHSRIDIVSLRDGTLSPVYDTGTLQLDHAHFSPHDPDWIQFSDGSPHSRHRMWLWHRTRPLEAIPVFPQILPDGARFDIGHERAMFNASASIVICYGDSKDCIRGLYKLAYADGTPHLVSASNHDSHCNISRDGRVAVVSQLLDDVLDPARHVLDLSQPAVSDWTSYPSAVVDSRQALHFYVDSDVTLVDMRTGSRQFLLRGTNAIDNGKSLQPWEVQPAFSPDSRWILCKDGKTRSVFVLETDMAGLDAFLA